MGEQKEVMDWDQTVENNHNVSQIVLALASRFEDEGSKDKLLSDTAFCLEQVNRSRLAMRSQLTAALARAETAEAERDELREVVEKLPKTADGVPVCPGDFAFFEHRGQVSRMVIVSEFWKTAEVTIGTATRWYALPVSHETLGTAVPIGRGSVVPEMCYSTRQAAEQALAEREGRGDG